MIDWIIIVTKLIDVLKNFFEKMMFWNIVENASFDKKRKQIFDSLSFTFATFVRTFVVNFLNQLLNFKVLKLIKTLKKKNEKKNKKAAKDAQKMILILIISKKNLKVVRNFLKLI